MILTWDLTCAGADTMGLVQFRKQDEPPGQERSKVYDVPWGLRIGEREPPDPALGLNLCDRRGGEEEKLLHC